MIVGTCVLTSKFGRKVRAKPCLSVDDGVGVLPVTFYAAVSKLRITFHDVRCPFSCRFSDPRTHEAVKCDGR